MHIEIKTSVLKPSRLTYANVEERIGPDKPASRYQEATLDLQPSVNFHYRPTWAPEYEIYDRGRTAVKMEDWYAIEDPRQFYYATYTIARSRMGEVQDKNFKFVEKRRLLDGVSEQWKTKVVNFLVPLRHYEWGANMNNTAITDYGYGTAITQQTIFAAMDRLGNAQTISRIGLLLFDNAPDGLDKGKDAWLNDPMWQDVRHMIEDSFVVEDWFELFVAQNFAMDGIAFPLVFTHIDEAGLAEGGAALSMLSEFPSEWFVESNKWVDAAIKVVVAESEDNAALISDWASSWATRALRAFRPVAEYALGEAAEVALASTVESLEKRAGRIGINLNLGGAKS